MSSLTKSQSSVLSVYQNLPTKSCTRIFSLIPVAEGETLAAELKVIDLDDKEHERYDALSYAWGTTELTEQVLCRSKNGSATIWITSNLAHVLRRLQTLRDHDLSLCFWADALSINQSVNQEALQERAQQVQMMNRVFMSAHRVISYLGEESDNFELLKSCLDRMWGISDEDFEKMKNGEDDESVLDRLQVDFRLLNSIGQLYGRPYLVRVWTLQEFVLADEISFLIGSKLYDGELFVPAILRVVELLLMKLSSAAWDPAELQKALSSWAQGPSGLSQLRRFAQIRSFRRNGTLQNISICRLIREAWFCLASDPRDKFYALLGLANEIDAHRAQDIQVDYTKDVDSLSLDVTRLFLQDDKYGFDLFDMMVRADSHLPSWSLDLKAGNEPNQREFLLVAIDARSKHFYTARESIFDVKLEPNNKFISLSACLIDMVVHLGPIEPPVPKCVLTEADIVAEVGKSHRWCQDVIEWTENVMSHLPKEKIFEMRWRTLCADTTLKSTSPNTVRERATKDMGIFYSSFVENMEHLHEKMEREYSITDDNVERGGKSMQWQLHCSNFEDCVIGCTELRRLTLLPIEAISGDQIAIISGLQLPFVLRRQPDESYKIVGECYVHGIMDGEAFDQEGFGFSTLLIS